MSGEVPPDVSLAPSAEDRDALLQMIGASWMTRAICVAAELGVADRLQNGPCSSVELAASIGCDQQALHRLLRGLASLGLCTERLDATFELTPRGVLLREDAEGSLRSWSLWWGKFLWPVWGDLIDSVRTGRSARELATGLSGYAHVERNAAMGRVFNQAMREMTRITAPAIVAALDLSTSCRVIDVGGGHGELLTALLAANPLAHGVLFDMPHAVDGAATLLDRMGLATRCDVVSGDFFLAVPTGGDIYVLKSILHNWDDEHCRAILRNCLSAMATDGRVVIVERTLPERMTCQPRDAAVARSDLNMLVGLGGRERTLRQLTGLLSACGFELKQVVPLPADYAMVEATRH